MIDRNIRHSQPPPRRLHATRIRREVLPLRITSVHHQISLLSPGCFFFIFKIPDRWFSAAWKDLLCSSPLIIHQLPFSLPSRPIIWMTYRTSPFTSLTTYTFTHSLLSFVSLTFSRRDTFLLPPPLHFIHPINQTNLPTDSATAKAN